MIVNRLRFGTKIGLAFGILIGFAFINILIYFLLYINTGNAAKNMEQIITSIKKIYMIRILEKEFIIDKNRDFSVKADKYIVEIGEETKKITENLEDKAAKEKLLKTMEYIKEYRRIFNSYIKLEEQKSALNSRALMIADNLLKFTRETKYTTLKSIGESDKNLILSLILYSRWDEQFKVNKEEDDLKVQILATASEIIDFAEKIKKSSSKIEVKLAALDIILQTNDYVDSYYKYEEIKRLQIENEILLTNISSTVEDNYTAVYAKIQQEVKEKNINFIRITTIFLFISTIISIVLTVVISRGITNPLNKFIKATKMISNGDYSRSLAGYKYGEIGELSESFNTMADNLKKSEDRLLEYNKLLEQNVSKRTEELSNTLDHLKKTQSQLIQSEKMAALGQLIAGIAHEINTPIGAISSSIGLMKKEIKNIINDYSQFVDKCSDEEMTNFKHLLKKVTENKESISSKEERQLKKKMSEKLGALCYIDTTGQNYCDDLIDMGIYEADEKIAQILKGKNGVEAIKIAAQFSTLIRGIEIIGISVARASKIVYALKSFARIDDTAEKSEANIIDGIEVTLTLYQNIIRQGIEVVKEYQPIPKIMCYPDDLNQVWTNLIHNAVQAMSGNGVLTIGVKMENNQIIVSVGDTGSGIAENVKDKIFEPFFTTKSSGEGSGIGLDIVKKIIEKHNGKIYFESCPGKTIFYVEIPLEI